MNARGVGEKVRLLEQVIGAAESALVAFSGGVDSTYLLYKSAAVLNSKVLAVTVHSQLQQVAETDAAEKISRRLGVKHLVLTLDLVNLPAVLNNSPERCYECKKYIFQKMHDLAGKYGLAAVFEGSNADDSPGLRPGMKALSEANVQSPLAAAGLNKAEIRQLAREAGLQNWDQPAAACLATRFPRGQRLEPRKMAAVAEAEALLRQFGATGDLRVRVHGSSLARIELSTTAWPAVLEHRKEITARLKSLGFSSVTLDLEGFRPGSMN